MCSVSQSGTVMPYYRLIEKAPLGLLFLKTFCSIDMAALVLYCIAM
jgi:hypothetical protein